MATHRFKELDQKTLESLSSGGFFIAVNEKDDGSLDQVTAGIMIKAPVERVWDVVTDYEQYVNFMPQTEKVKEKRIDEKTSDVSFELHLKVSIIKVKVKYTSRHVHNKPYSIEWHNVSGDFKSKGAWEFVPSKDGKNTIVLYSAYADLTTLGRTVGRMVSLVFKQVPMSELGVNISSAAMVAKSVKERVETLFGN